MTKIMLVEDDKSLREIYGVRLKAEGYEIISAGDGEEALAMAIKEHPGLIVSDVMMPKISGFDMLDILRATPETKDIKVIMMTALSSEDQRARGESLGADRYLVKSQVGIEDVVKTVHEMLSDAPNTVGQSSQAFGAPVASEIVTTEQSEQPMPVSESQPTVNPIIITEPETTPSETVLATSEEVPVQEVEPIAPALINQPETETAPVSPQTVPIVQYQETQLPKPDISLTAAPVPAPSELTTFAAPIVPTPEPTNEPTTVNQPTTNLEIVEEMSERLNKSFKDGSDTTQTAEEPGQPVSTQ